MAKRRKTQIRKTKTAAGLAMPAGIPKRWALVCPVMVKHPVDGGTGALLRHKNTGLYGLFIAGTFQGIDQAAAREFDRAENL